MDQATDEQKENFKYRIHRQRLTDDLGGLLLEVNVSKSNLMIVMFYYELANRNLWAKFFLQPGFCK